MQIPRFGLAASLGMTKQVGESRFEDPRSQSERSGLSDPWSGVSWSDTKRRFQSPEMVHDRLEPKGPKPLRDREEKFLSPILIE